MVHKVGRWVDLHAHAGQIHCGLSRRCHIMKHSEPQGTLQKQLNLRNQVPRGVAPPPQKDNIHR